MIEELIRRSDAIKVLEQLSACEEYGVEIGTDDETYIGKYEAITEISDIPAVEPKQGEWIPCSERLPSESGFYLCTVNKEYTHVRQMKFENIDSGYRWLLMNGTRVEDRFVLAWKPRPEPWKGADE